MQIAPRKAPTRVTEQCRMPRKASTRVTEQCRTSRKAPTRVTEHYRMSRKAPTRVSEQCRTSRKAPPRVTEQRRMPRSAPGRVAEQRRVSRKGVGNLRQRSGICALHHWWVSNRTARSRQAQSARDSLGPGQRPLGLPRTAIQNDSIRLPGSTRGGTSAGRLPGCRHQSRGELLEGLSPTSGALRPDLSNEEPRFRDD